MSAVSGQGTTFNLPNFVGPLYKVTPRETPFLAMIGGLHGGRSVTSKIVTWQTVDNADATQPAILEGADPDYYERDRSEVSNTLQIFQYGVETSYTKQATVGQLGDWSTRVWAVLGDQPVQSEQAFQLMLTLERAARDVEYSMINGTYQYPSNNSTGRKMRGILAAISTNSVSFATTVGNATFEADDELWTLSTHGLQTGDEVQFSAVGTGATGTGCVVNTSYWVIRSTANAFYLATSLDNALAGTNITGTADSAGTWTVAKGAPLTKSGINRLIRKMVAAGAPLREPVILCGSFNRQRASDVYGYAPESRTVGGVNIQSIVTDFGDLPIVFDRQMPASKLAIVDMSVIEPVFLEIPGKGHFFIEDKPASGSSVKQMLYGEIGLTYGYEAWHGVITGLTTDEQV
jgi:hypothetical protein